MAALMSSTSAFVGAKVAARVNVRSERARCVIMANTSGPKRVRFEDEQFSRHRARRWTRRVRLATHTAVVWHRHRSWAWRIKPVVRLVVHVKDVHVWKRRIERARLGPPSDLIANIESRIDNLNTDQATPFPLLFRQTGHQGQGWPGWCWLQRLHRGGLRAQAVSTPTLFYRCRQTAVISRNTTRCELVSRCDADGDRRVHAVRRDVSTNTATRIDA
jgi:hypothetical protein